MAGGRPRWIAPRQPADVLALRDRRARGLTYDADAGSLEACIALLGRHASVLPAGSFVFVLSDFIDAVPARVVGPAARTASRRDAGRDPGSDVGAELSGGRRGRAAGRRPGHGRGERCLAERPGRTSSRAGERGSPLAPPRAVRTARLRPRAAREQRARRDRGSIPPLVRPATAAATAERVTRRVVGAAMLAVVLAGAPTGAAATPALTGTVVPGAPQFGDSFAYTVVLELPAATQDAERSLSAPVAPFTSVAPSRVTRSSSEGTTRVSVVQTLACLTVDCVPQREARSVTLPAARARVEGVTLVADRVTVRVRPRVAPAGGLGRPPRLSRAGSFAGADDESRSGCAWPSSSRSSPAPSLSRPSARCSGVVGAQVRGRQHVDPLARAIRLLRESAEPLERRPATRGGARVACRAGGRARPGRREDRLGASTARPVGRLGARRSGRSWRGRMSRLGPQIVLGDAPSFRRRGRAHRWLRLAPRGGDSRAGGRRCS